MLYAQLINPAQATNHIPANSVYNLCGPVVTDVISAPHRIHFPISLCMYLDLDVRKLSGCQTLSENAGIYTVA